MNGQIAINFLCTAGTVLKSKHGNLAHHVSAIPGPIGTIFHILKCKTLYLYYVAGKLLLDEDAMKEAWQEH